MNLPDGWTASEPLPHDQIYSDPPENPNSSLINIYGAHEADAGHRLYSIPAETPLAEIIQEFGVGSHSSISYGHSVKETVALVTSKATEIGKIIPFRPTFADSAGLKLRFNRQITENELERITALFSDTEMMQAGLERYLSESDGEHSIFAPVMKENLFHFWWD